jgi:ribose-phosphate pyrophosphokinase
MFAPLHQNIFHRIIISHSLSFFGVDRVVCMDLHNDSLRGFFSPRTPVEHLRPVPVAAAYFHEEICGPTEQQQQQQYEQSTSSSSSSFMKQKLTSSNDKPKITIVASHEGNVEHATEFRSVLQRLSGEAVELAVLSKTKMRQGEQKYYSPNLIGNVKGRKCVLVDDIVNTGTTLIS